MLEKLITFYKQHLRNEDKLVLGGLLFAGIIGAIYILINALTTQYSGNQFVNWAFFLGFPIMAALYSLSLYVRETSARVGLVTWTYTTYFFMLLGLGTLVYGAQFTPFHPIDSVLVSIDQALGFSQTAVLNWTHAHTTIEHLFNQAYSTIGWQLSFIPLILALMLDRRSVKVLFMGIIFSFVIGTGIYYFLPTTAPASMFFDPNFVLQQHDTFIKFFEIHHYLPITTQEGGLIAFPSFHVIWCVLLAYSLKNKKWLFYPVVLLNSFIIASTLFLGWHYLTDVIGGLTMAGVTIWVCEAIYQKYITKEDSKECVAEIKVSPIKPTTQQIPTGAMIPATAKLKKQD